MKKLLQFLFHRVVFTVIALLIQILILFAMVVRFQDYFVYFYGFTVILSIVLVMYIVNGRSNPGYKIAWIIPVLLVPVFGVLLYALFGWNNLSPSTIKKMKQVESKMISESREEAHVLHELKAESRDAYVQSRYLFKYSFSPAYKGTFTDYLPSGEIKFERLKQELKKARHYIFMEYFIIEEGIMWNTVLDILKQKVTEGVDVRIIYDDMGCLMTLPPHYDRTLRQYGIKCSVFNKFVPVLSSKLNNRDHRKICVIDGHTGFTGGINLADEYINAYEKHGHWKDTAIILKGDAVWSLTVMFLAMWDYINRLDEDFEKFKPDVHRTFDKENDGFVQPYADSPFDGEPVGETVYLNMINRAKDYIHITTPYLIIDNEMTMALSIAAKSGIDVKIITPHIADKWFVHSVTRAYYRQLIEAGVKIYEYTPGFIHAKTVVVDDIYAVVGTINFDYRSLYLHFECGTFLYKTRSVSQIRDDFLKTLEVCQNITLDDCKKVKWYKKIGRAFLKLFAPLM